MITVHAAKPSVVLVKGNAFSLAAELDESEAIADAVPIPSSQW